MVEKDIGKITKNQDTDIVIRIDDFGGKVGLTIREFVNGERYQGFTKAGTRIPADQFKVFKELVNSVDEEELGNLVNDALAAQGQETLGENSSSGGVGGEGSNGGTGDNAQTSSAGTSGEQKSGDASSGEGSECKIEEQAM